MEIRTAKVEDAERIRQISLDLTIKRNSSSQGLVEYPTPSIEEMRKRISGNPYFYVAHIGEEIIGFLSAYESSLMLELDFSRDQIAKYIIENKTPPFIYWDQVGVVKEWQNRGRGIRLANRFVYDSVQNRVPTILGAISLRPISNDLSLRIAKKLGFVQDDKRTFYNGLVFGIFKKDLR